jgi:hypothetical protein
MPPLHLSLLACFRQLTADMRCSPQKMYFITHHKCASSWLRSYLARVCELNALELSTTHLSNDLADSKSAISLICNGDYEYVKTRILGGVHVIRNPFDLLCSAYYSHIRVHPVDGWMELAQQREILQAVPYDIGIMLTIAFLERTDFDQRGAIGPFAALRRWDYDDPRFQTVRMEDMVTDPTDTFGKALRLQLGNRIILPDEQEFRFEAFSGQRAPGIIDDNSHYRVGKPGYFRESLPSGAVKYINTHFGPLIKRFYPEYETDGTLMM